MAKKSAAEEQQEKLINLQAQQLAAQVANWAAQLEFQKERLRLLELPEMQGKMQVDIDRLAWEKTQGTWEKAFKEATLSGTYNGVPTIEWLTQQAQLTGVLNGEQTLQGKLSDAQIRQMNESMRLANEEFLANTTGYLNGRPTFDREKFQAGQAQDAWKFLATLTGPANAFKQARAIASMPGGMADLMGAWAGQYAMPGSSPVGSGGRAGFEGLMMGYGGNYGYQPPAAAPITGPQGYTGTGMYQPVQGTPLPAPPYPTYVPPAAPGYGDISPGGPGAVPPPAPVVPGPSDTVDTGPTGPIGGPVFTDPGGGGSPAPAVKPAPAPWQPPGPGEIGIPRPPDTVGKPPPQIVPPGPGEVGISGGIPFMGETPAPFLTNSMFNASPTFAPTSYSFQPSGVQAPIEHWNYSPTTSGSMQVYPPGVQSPHHTPDISAQNAMAPTEAYNLYQYGGPQQAQPVAQPTNAPGEIGQGYSGPLLPNQINARNYGNTYQYAKDLGWAGYEDAGWDKNLAMESFERSLPRTGGPKVGSFAF